MLLLPLLMLLLFPSTALSRRQFDWNDCRLQACYVPDSCRDVTTTTTGSSTPAPPEALVLVTRARPLTNRTACPFVMAIRPFSTTAWVVQLRLRQTKRLRERRIIITRDSKLVYECAGHDNGSVTLTGGDDVIAVHRDSYRAHARMYCLFTVTSKSGNALDTSGFEVVYDGQSKALKLDSMDKIMDYVSCDGTKITMSSLKPDDDSFVAPVDFTRPVVACPPGKNWQLWVENPMNGTLIATGSIVCSPTILKYYIDAGDGKDDLWEMSEFKAVCASSLACTTCAAPLFSPCPLCARVRHWPGEPGHCSTLTCDNKISGGPSRFSIDGRHYVGEPICAPKEDGTGIGWSIKDARNRTVEFGAAACVKEVSCHSASFLQLECADAEQCARPLAVEFDEGEGMICPERLRMRFRATDADAWTDAHELLCDALTGHWSAFHGGNDDKTVLAHNTTVECVAPLDPALFYGSIAVTVGMLLFCATFLPHFLWTRKSDAEFDKRQAELSKAFAKIKEYPKSPEKSDRERSRQSEVKEEKEVGKPIVDTRIYPDELTLKRKKKKKKEDKKEEKKVVEADFLRPRELEDPIRIFCKSIKEGKEGWEQWIAKTGGIVQEKKPREEVLRIRAERKAAREKRIEEEKQRKAEEERMSAKPDAPSSPAPMQSAVKSTGGGGGLATDQYLYRMGVTPPQTTKEKPKEDRFVTIGAVTPSRPPPKKYKKHSTGAAPAKDEEIKFDPPTISRDTASVLHLEPASRKRTEEFVTAEETDLNEETDAREKTPARTDDRAISASKMGPRAKPSELAPPRTDDRAISASKMGPPAKPSSDLAPPRTDDRAISASKMGPPAVHQSPKDESGMADVAVEGTEDEKRKRKKRKTKKTSKSGGEDLPKTMTAVDNEPTVDVDRNNQNDKGVQSTPVMTSPSPLSPSNSTPTAETKRKRKKHREAVESKGIAKGLAKHLAKKGSGTRSPRYGDGPKKE